MSSMLGPLTTPLYILPDHLASSPTTLRAKHNTRGGFAFSKFPSETEETIPPEPLFTVASRSTLRAPRRLIHNASTNQPLLELWRNHVGNESYIGVPNSAALPLATLAPRPTKVRDRVDVYVKNAALGGEEVKLEVRGQDVWKRNTCVYWGNEVVAQVRFVNYVTSYVPFSSNQWDVVVAEGFDLSLACAIVVYLGTTLYDSSAFRSGYGLEEAKDEDGSGKGKSRKWMMMGAVIGAGGGAGAGAAA